MTDKPSVIRETDDEARTLARMLLRSARHVALAVIETGTGFPFASRVLLGTDIDGVPAILVSALSTHTKSLEGDPRASVLAGLPGKGDPLAYARLTVQCLAERVERDDPVHARLRQRFLNRHPKSKLYIDFPDFCFFRLVPQSASLNGGFGKAFILPGADLMIALPRADETGYTENESIAAFTSQNPDFATRTAVGLGGAKNAKWQICGLDLAGFDLANGDELFRYEFAVAQESRSDSLAYMSKMEYTIREI